MADEWNSNSNTWAGSSLAIGEAHPIFLVDNEFFQADTKFFGEETGTVNSLLERIGIPLVADKVDPSSVKLITKVWPLITGKIGDQIEICVGAQENSPDEAPVYEAPVIYTLGTTEFIDAMSSGRYAALKFKSISGDPTDEPWTLMQYVIDFQVIGLH